MWPCKCIPIIRHVGVGWIFNILRPTFETVQGGTGLNPPLAIKIIGLHY